MTECSTKVVMVLSCISCCTMSLSRGHVADFIYTSSVFQLCWHVSAHSTRPSAIMKAECKNDDSVFLDAKVRWPGWGLEAPRHH